MNEDTIELFYESDYNLEYDPSIEEDEEHEIYDFKREVEGVSIVSKEDYLNFYADTMYNPCKCHIGPGCLSCFLDENDLWTRGYGENCTCLWFGKDPATGKHWNPEEILRERGYFDEEE